MCLCLLIDVSTAADFAKIFKDGMVLQSDPTTAVIWGWQEGNPDDWPPVYLSSDCNFNMETFQMNQQYTSKKVKRICKYSYYVGLIFMINIFSLRKLVITFSV